MPRQPDTMTTRRARKLLVAGLAGLFLLSCGAGPVVCPELNASKLRLVTFDVFGALMQTQADLRRSVGEALPALSSDVAALVAGDMVSSYAGYMDSGGFVFDSGVHTPPPRPSTAASATTSVNMSRRLAPTARMMPNSRARARTEADNACAMLKAASRQMSAESSAMAEVVMATAAPAFSDMRRS